MITVDQIRAFLIELEVNGSFSDCPHCKFLAETFCNNGEKNDREYWLMTEVFVYLHKSDVCNLSILQHGK